MGDDEGRAKLAGRDDRVEEPFRGWVDLGRGSEGRERKSELLRAKRQTREASERLLRELRRNHSERKDKNQIDYSGDTGEALYNIATL